MARSSRALPAALPGWPDPERLEAEVEDPATRDAAVVLATWRNELAATIAGGPLSRAAIAKGANVSTRTVERVVAGGSWPDILTMVAISGAAGIAVPGVASSSVDPARPRCRTCVHHLGFLSTQRDRTWQDAWEVIEHTDADDGDDWFETANCAWVELLRRRWTEWGVTSRHPLSDYQLW